MRFTHTVKKPFNFEATLKTHGWFELVPFYWDFNTKTLNWAIRLEKDHPLLVKISEKYQTLDKTHSEIEFILNNNVTDSVRDHIIYKFRYIFNLDLDLDPFYKMCTQYQALQQVPSAGIGRIMRSESVFEDIFKSICGTNVQWKQAVKMINTISQLGQAVTNTEYCAFPTPQQILKAGESWLKDVGRVGYRSGYLIELCERFVDSEPIAHRAENGDMPAKELKSFFLSFKGIGKVTTNYLLALYGHFDDLAVDSLVISFMAQKHFNGTKPTEKQVKDFYAEFGQWRYLAYWMEFIMSGGWIPDEK